MAKSKRSNTVQPKFGVRWLALGVLGIVLLVGGYLSLRPRDADMDVETQWRKLAGDLAPEQLNIILITIDTLRADRLAAYGYDRIETPNIDRLSAEGVRFANAASTVPFTFPAHSSIMTGTYPPYHGVRENVGYFLDESIPTLAELMRERGWSTAGFVSAFVLDSRWGIGRGFDVYHDKFDFAGVERANLASVQRDGRETLAEAVSWLDGRPQTPFFLWLHLFDPHDPYTPPEPFKSRYPNRPYDGEIAYTDSLVGEFRSALEERNLLETSLLVLTGDHGEGMGSHREMFHGYFVYDSTVRVPLIVRAPFGDLGGGVVETAVSHVDLLPTILAATGQPVPEVAQGSSLLPLMLGRNPTEERAAYSESLYPLLHYGWSPLRSLRTTRYKFIDAPRTELYDLINDPWERNNLTLEKPEMARQMQESLTTLSAQIEGDRTRPVQQPDLDEETLQQLRALGYVAGRGSVALDEETDKERADPKDSLELHQLIMMAQSDIGRGDEEAAQERLRRLLERDPGIVDAHQMLGSIAQQRQDHEAAVGHFQNALELDPDHKTSLFGLATAYKELGRDDDALLGFRRLLELNPQDSKACLAAVEIHVSRGESAEAMELLEAATSAENPPAILFSQLGELLALEGRSSEAEQSFRRAIAGNDKLVAPHFHLAVLVEEQGNLEEAVRLYEETIALAPEHYQAQFNLGRIHGQRGNPDRQQELYEAAIESNPDFVRGYYYLAKLIMDRGGDLTRAEALTRQGLDRDPDHRTGPLGYFLLTDILNRLGRPAEAQQALQRAREIQGQG